MRNRIDKILNAIKNASRWQWAAGLAWLIFGVGLLVLYPYGGVFFEAHFSVPDFDDGRNLEAIRNIVLTMAALLAFPLALERMIIADKQLSATEDQLKASEKQNRDRDFQNWIANFFSLDEGMRYVAVEELWHFAQKHPEDYHVKVMRLFCNFIRNHSDCYKSEGDPIGRFSFLRSKKEEENPQPHGQLSTREEFIGEKNFNNILSMVINKGGRKKNTKQTRQERDEGYRIDLSGTNFSQVDLSDSDLTNADLRWTFWHQTNFEKMNWENCCIAKALFVPFGQKLDFFKEIQGKPISTPEMQIIYLQGDFTPNTIDGYKKYFNEKYHLEIIGKEPQNWLSEKKEEANILKPLPPPSS